MTTISLGEHSKLTVLPSERDRILSFYRDVLGCTMTRTSAAVDVLRLGSNFYLGFVYDDDALGPSDGIKSIWLELATDRLEDVKVKILAFGIRPIEYRDRDHFYFQAPGGQVYRLIDASEDMSKFER